MPNKPGIDFFFLGGGVSPHHDLEDTIVKRTHNHDEIFLTIVIFY